MTLGHALLDAVVDDDALGRSELRVFRLLWGVLNFEDFKAVKADFPALQLRLDRSQVSRSLQNLVDFGYLECGPRDEKGVGTYRLPRAVPSGVRQIHTSEKAPRMRRQVRTSL